MSIQVTTAPGALVALGLGVGDVAALVALGRRLGNWWTASDGDKEFLSLLDEAESSIVQRRGLLDVLAFNKRWRKKIQLLANGSPLRLEDRDIEQVLQDSKILLQDLSLFTSVMTCLVAVLEQFARPQLVRDILLNMLKSLLKLHENGEDVLKSQYSSRLNAWRSTSALRGLNHAANEHRLKLIRDGDILSGWLPEMESKHVENFLVWLLSSQEPVFRTTSSDVAGIAACLAGLGIDIVDVETEYSGSGRGLCTVIYSAQSFLHGSTEAFEKTRAIISRDPSITVPLQYPWEAVSVFPIGEGVHNRCRSAWKAAQRAAKAVKVCIQGADIHGQLYEEYYQSANNANNPKTGGIFAAQLARSNLIYAIVDVGTPDERSSSELYDIALSFGLVTNRELLSELYHCLGSTRSEVLSWLLTATKSGEFHLGSDISDPEMTDEERLNEFCVFQSFIMGYYYDVFGRLVDTSTLESQTVEGSWGFRSAEFLRYMRFHSLRVLPPSNTPHVRMFGRSRLLPLLSMLFLGGHATSYEPERAEEKFKGADCLGIVGKRTLLANSLLGKCSSPPQIGRFTLLDVDVGGVPRDFNGLVKPGVLPQELPLQDCLETSRKRVDIPEVSRPEDVTFHIEADWEANPDTALLCARYKGRRLATVSPIPADSLFCDAFVPPRPELHRRGLPRLKLSQGAEANISSLLKDDPVLPYSYQAGLPVLFQALDCPGLRYLASALYGKRADLKVATDCVENAKGTAVAAFGAGEVSFVIVGGMTKVLEEDIPIQQSYVSHSLYEIR